MNKRYIDFVPTAKTAEVESRVKAKPARQASRVKATIVMPKAGTAATPRKKVLDVAPRKKAMPILSSLCPDFVDTKKLFDYAYNNFTVTKLKEKLISKL